MQKRIPSSEILRRNIRYYRKALKMTQAEFAEKINLSHDFVRQVESKKVDKSFSTYTIDKVADVLGVLVMDLYNPKTAIDDERKKQ